MRKWILSAALLAAPVSSHAQVGVQFQNFTQTANGFTTTLLFRNVGEYGDPTIMAIGGNFSVGVSQKVRSFCSGVVTVCTLSSSGMRFQGPVQQTGLVVGGVQWLGGSFYNESSCGGIYCLSRNYDAFTQLGVLGCQVPFSPFGRDYVARTCDADGFTGSIRFNLFFSYATAGNQPAPPITFDASDIGAGFPIVRLAGENAVIASVPEPSTYALMAAGLLTLGLAARRRRTT